MRVFLHALFICLSLDTCAVDHNSLEILKDTLMNETKIYLVENNEIIDSLKLRYMDFKFDSLTKINDSLYHYIFSDTEFMYPKKSQLLIKIKENKLHVQFWGIYEQCFEQKRNEEFNTFVKSKSYKYTIDFTLLVEENLSITILRKDLFENDSIFKEESSSEICYLKHDENHDVYYTSYKVFDGFFRYSIYDSKNNNKYFGFKKIFFDVDTIPFLEYGSSKNFFHNNMWYWRFGETNHISLRRSYDLEQSIKNIIKEVSGDSIDDNLFETWSVNELDSFKSKEEN